jgi:hypothetical protein
MSFGMGRKARPLPAVRSGEIVAGVTGLEPAASGVTGRRSNRLSYTPFKGRDQQPEAILACMYGFGFGESR